MLVRKDFTEPADTTRQRKHGTENADRGVVTRPANSNAVPSARSNGHAVGAGTSISRAARGLSFRCPVVDGVAISSSASQNVNYRELTTTHTASTKCQYIESTAMRPGSARSNASGKSEYRDQRKHNQAHGDVKGMQADERVIGCSKQVRRDCESVFIDQPVPFHGRAVEEQAAQGNGQQPEAEE